MSKPKRLHVEIPTFLNPHLMWIFEIIKHDTRSYMEKHLKKALAKSVKADPIIGEIVAVECGGIWKRAIVKSIEDQYVCWLIDYGTAYHSSLVYDIPISFKVEPPMIKQACLLNVVCVDTKLDLAAGNQDYVEISGNNPGSCKKIREYIKKASDTFFNVLEEKDGIYYGDIILSDSGGSHSLIDILVKERILAVNEPLFQKAITNNEVRSEEFVSFLRTLSACSSKSAEKQPDSIDMKVMQRVSRTLFDPDEDEHSSSEGIGRGCRIGRSLKPDFNRTRKSLLSVKQKLEVLSTSSDSNFATAEEDCESVENSEKALIKSAQSPSYVAVNKPSPTNISTKRTPRTLDVLKIIYPTTKQDKSDRITETLAVDDSDSAHNIVSTDESKEEFKECEVLPSALKIPSSAKNTTKKSPRTLDILKALNPKQQESKEENKCDEVEHPAEKLEDKTNSNSQAQSFEDALSALKNDKSSNLKIVPAGYGALIHKSGSNLTIKSKASLSPCRSTSSASDNRNISLASGYRSNSRAGSQSKRKLRPNSRQNKIYSPTEMKSTFDLEVRSSTSVASSYTDRSSSSLNNTRGTNNIAQRVADDSSSCEEDDGAINKVLGVCPNNKLIGCTCESCLLWDKNDINQEEDAFSDTESIPKTKVVTKPALLLKNEQVQEEATIKCGSFFSSTKESKMQKLRSPCLLVHGPMIPEPIYDVRNVQFQREIHRALINSKFELSKSIQSYVWPAILRNMNVFYIMGAKSGKTMAYLVPVLSFLTENEKYSCFFNNFKGPIVVIVCQGTKEAEEVFDLTSTFLSTVQRKMNLALAVPPIDDFCLAQFTKSCDILIATPLCLLTLLKNNKINMKRLCHLVFEDADLLLKKYPRHIDTFLNLAQSVLENRTCQLSIQLIAPAKNWTSQLEDLAKKLTLKPLICIGAHLEAAVYGRINIKMHFLESKSKPSALVDILTEEENLYSKCIVICKTDAELKEAAHLFPSRSLPAIIITKSMPSDEISTREAQWGITKDGSYSILLCTDYIFNTSVRITDATLLVHYTLPQHWTVFAHRFSALLDNYKSPLASNKKNGIQTQCKSYIFVDENCSEQSPRLVEFLNKMNVKLPPKFSEYYKNVVVANENRKVQEDIPLCSELKLLGKCIINKCRKRHTISKELDDLPIVPSSGPVKFNIVYVKDVTVYCINILEYTDTNGKIVSNDYDATELQERLRQALQGETNYSNDVNVGDVLAVKEKDGDVYSRCKILKVLNCDHITKSPTVLKVLCLDSGFTEEVSYNQLYYLPKEFMDIPFQGVTAYVANMAPPGNDSTYSSHSRLHLKKMLNANEKKYGEAVYMGDVVLRLGHNLWMKNIRLIRNLPMSNTTVSLFNIEDKLVKRDLAEYNENMLKPLIEQAESVGIQVAKILKAELAKIPPAMTIKKQIQPQWAFFDETTSYNEVYFSSAESPSEFYVRLKKFQKQFENLQHSIEEAINKPFYPTKFDVEVGQCYLAQDPQGSEFHRVKVVNVVDEIATCFYVDFGDTCLVNIQELKYLSNELIAKLPFQVIECRLFGIAPVLDVWSSEATDILYDEYCYEPGTDYFRTLYSVICKKERACHTDQKYAILLIDSSKMKNVIINNLTIECGLAVCDSNEDLSSVEIPRINVVCDEDYNDSDIEEVENAEIMENIDEIEEEIARLFPNGSCDDEKEFDFECFDIAKLISGEPINVGKVTHYNSNYEDYFPIMHALPPAKYCTPQVVWYQSEEHVTINIMLPVTQYNMKLIRGKILHFSADYDEKPYQLDLHLFGKIMKTFQDTCGGPVVRVTLNKCEKIEWPRLVVQKNMRHIKYDLSRCTLPDDEDKKKPILSLPKEFDQPLLGENEFEICVGSDSDNSVSDVESTSD